MRPDAVVGGGLAVGEGRVRLAADLVRAQERVLPREEVGLVCCACIRHV